MPVIAKINKGAEYWRADDESQFSAYSAARSVESGRIISYELIDELPADVTAGAKDSWSGVSVHYPMTPAALSNAEHQRRFHNRKKDAGFRLLRVYVPVEKYIEAKQYCEALGDK